MRYQEFKEKLHQFPVFNLTDIRKVVPGFYRTRLNEWQEKGYIKKLRRGYYTFSDQTIDEQGLFLIANRLYSPSYISFEMALSHYGLIPESVYLITSASSRKTAHFKTPLGEFSYTSIKSDFFFGYKLEEKNGQRYAIAEMEKAVLDYAYIHPNITNEDSFAEWRFNSEEFMRKADIKKFNEYAQGCKNSHFLALSKKLLNLIKISR